MPPPARGSSDHHHMQSPESPVTSGGAASKLSREKALETLARYEEVERLFASQFPTAEMAAATATHMSTFMPQAGLGGNYPGGFMLSPDQGSDTYDPDQELALELNEDMGLVSRKSISGGSLFEYPRTTFEQNINPALLDDVNSHTSYSSLPNSNYPFTSPAAGELMVTASPDHASYAKSPPRDTKAGEAVEDLGWLGAQLQQNARRQLQNLNESGMNFPQAS
jgi:hypothetical protein